MKFKVVKIVDEYLIVINYGLRNHASEGDILEIINIGEEVIDPDTSESLGTLDMIKGRVKVKNVYDYMSLCISDEKIIVSNPGLSSFNQTIATLSQKWTSSEIKALSINTKEVTGGYDEKSGLTINLSDPVRIKKSKTNDIAEDI